MDKTGWTKVKLGDICKITIGEFVKKTEQSDDKPYPVWNGGITNTGFYDQYNMDGQYILVSARGANAGYTNKINGKYWAGNSVYSIKVSNNCDYEYVYYAIKYNQPSLIGQQLTGSIPAISKKQVEELTIDLPPMEIQLQIAKLLTTIDNIIQSKLDESTKYQNMKTQIMNDIFANGEREQNWAKVKLGDMCKVKSGGTPSSKNLAYYDGDIPFLTINDMTSQGKHVKETMKHITEDAINSCSTYKAPAGSLVYSMCASVGFVSFIDVEFTMNQAIAVLNNMDKRVNLDYLYYYLDRLRSTPEFESYIITGTQRNINATILKSFEIPLPPMEIQLMIANLLTMYDDMIDTVNKEKDDYEKIKAQMMNMIFA